MYYRNYMTAHLFLTDAGDMYVWGWNESGQLGLPCSDRTTPQSGLNSDCFVYIVQIVQFQISKYFDIKTL